jgi:hypothetical protein
MKGQIHTIDKGGMSEAEEDRCQRMAEAEMGLLLDHCYHMATGGDEVVGSFMMRARHHRVNLISGETGPEG